MDGILTQTDLVVFFGSLIAVMAVGLWVGRREKTSEDYFLAGKIHRGGVWPGRFSGRMFRLITWSE